MFALHSSILFRILIPKQISSKLMLKNWLASKKSTKKIQLPTSLLHLLYPPPSNTIKPPCHLRAPDDPSIKMAPKLWRRQVPGFDFLSDARSQELCRKVHHLKGVIWMFSENSGCFPPPPQIIPLKNRVFH